MNDKFILLGLHKEDSELLDILKDRIGKSIYRISIHDKLEGLKDELIEELDYE